MWGARAELLFTSEFGPAGLHYRVGMHECMIRIEMYYPLHNLSPSDWGPHWHERRLAMVMEASLRLGATSRSKVLV